MAGLIVHEWFAKHGGSENVVEQMLEALPESDLQVLWNDRDPKKRPARETWIARTPLRNSKALSLPFQLPTWRHLPSSVQYDWMLVSSHLFAHHARLRSQPSLPKYVYAHTPARYIWAPELDTRGAARHIRLASAFLKPIDRKRAQEAVRIAANSEFTRERILRAWGRDADVIYPPVDIERITSRSNWADMLSAEDAATLESLPEGFLLGASRMVPYKRLDAVIDAGEATGSPVVLAGAGPLWEALSARANVAGVPVLMVHRPSDELLFALYQACRAFVFPAVEDFGIMPVEAMAAGAPAIVPTAGGASESVALVRGGVAVTGLGADDWRWALTQADHIDRENLPARTEQLSNSSFQRRVRGWLEPAHDPTEDVTKP